MMWRPPPVQESGGRAAVGTPKATAKAAPKLCAVSGAVHDAVGGAVHGAVNDAWRKYLGGQFWVGGWWYGVAYVSFFRYCGLELPGDLWARSEAYHDTCRAACWWWPTRDYVVVSERPSEIHRELVDPARPRGWRSHRLHCETGPAVRWDGWGVYVWHGVRVSAEVIEHPETITPETIQAEPNTEVRRVMIERMGWDRYLSATAAQPVQTDRFGQLYRLRIGEVDSAVVLVQNSTPEPDGSVKQYGLLVEPSCQTAHEAVASTFGLTPETYQLAMET